MKKIDLLISIYATCLCLANIMGAKTFPLVNLFGYQLNASVGIFIFPLLFSINDIISEVYGKQRAKSILYSNLIMIVFVMLFSLFTTTLNPTSRFALSEKAYDTIFGVSARMCAASLSAFIISGLIDIHIFNKLKKRFKNKMLWFRSNASNFLSQFIDTVVFMTLALYAFDKNIADNISFLFSLILPYWLLKCFMSVIETPITYWGVKWLGKTKLED